MTTADQVASRTADAIASLDTPVRKHVAAFIVDISGFTAFAETIEPEILLGLLREFHAALGAAILGASGTVVNFAGDQAFVVFNGPIDVADPERRAVRAALELRDRFTVLSGSWARQGHALGLRIGLHAGFATLGPIGYPGRYELGVIGRTVNTAGRVLQAAQPGQVLATARTLAGLEDSLELGAFSELAPKGLLRPLRVAEILAERR